MSENYNRPFSNERNLTMLMDFYELSMANGYLKEGYQDVEVVFDMFFRRVPDKGGFAIFAGLQQLITYLNELSFNELDLEFMQKEYGFGDEFIDYLRDFQFTCDVWAVKEGTPIFPHEPIVIIKGPAMQAQLIETMLLLTINHQTMIATKTNRIVRAAEGRSVSEYGSRRAHGYDAALLGARAAYIGGASSTSCTMAHQVYGVPAGGTMAHSWVQLFENEYEAFKSYAANYPDNCVLLVDTYNVLNSGVPNAIKVFDEIVVPTGNRPQAIRIDSGDLAYLSKKARNLLDDAGYSDVKIIASNALDEYIIRDLLIQNAAIDVFGVGENLITSKSEPVFGGVYKLAAVERNGVITPKIKVSETIEKVTNPHFKMLYRFYDKTSGKALADYITIHDEVVDDSGELEIFDPKAPWKRKNLDNFVAVPLLVKIFDRGVQVYDKPKLEDIRAYSAAEIDKLWAEVKRFEYPHKYYVDLSQRLFDLKQSMLNNIRVEG